MSYVFNILKGGVVGLANLIPGVSGGTMALILGIYERMIAGLNSISLDLFLSFFKLLTFKKKNWELFLIELEKIDFKFLVSVFGGALLAILAFASIMVYSLNNYHDQTYGFFWGLVLPSVWVPFKLIKKITPAVSIAFVCATLLVVSTDFLMSDNEQIQKEQQKYEIAIEKTQSGSIMDEFDINPLSLFLLFVAGAVSVSAMILPGISGSFVLLLMGQYFIVLKAVSSFNIVYLAVFSVGLVFGLLSFTKLLHYLLKKFHDITMGALTGLVFGSLWVIWPFKTSYLVGEVGYADGYPQLVYLSNVIPEKLTLVELSSLLSVLAGITVVLVMIKIEKANNQ
ncbi:MAG TPA: DUF368 domain-containing protein [Spirochaetota bacterium]|nr:DUF368 domain-containing protein [Spirochaetota bacterium]